LFYGYSKLARWENWAPVGMGYCRLRGDNPSRLETKDFVPGFILIGALLTILVSLSVITWKWFSGKEQ